jgi:hypothetical protein
LNDDDGVLLDREPVRAMMASRVTPGLVGTGVVKKAWPVPSTYWVRWVSAFSELHHKGKIESVKNVVDQSM